MIQTLTPVTFALAEQALARSRGGLATPFANKGTQLILPPNAITVVAAKTGEGKTSLMLNLLLHGLKENGETCFHFVSYKEPYHHLLIKLLMILSEVCLDKEDNFRAFEEHFRTHSFSTTNPENEKFREPLGRMGEWLEWGRLQLYRTELACDLLADELRGKACDRPVGGIFIDYIQRVGIPKSCASKDRHLQLKAVSESLLALANDVDTPIVVGTQRGRQYQSKEGASLIDSIRESSDISHDASLVLVLDKEGKGLAFQKKYKLHVAKNRFGRSDYHMDLVFDGPSYSFTGVTPRENSPSFEIIPQPNARDEEPKEWKDSPTRDRRRKKNA